MAALHCVECNYVFYPLWQDFLYLDSGLLIIHCIVTFVFSAPNSTNCKVTGSYNTEDPGPFKATAPFKPEFLLEMKDLTDGGKWMWES